MNQDRDHFEPIGWRSGALVLLTAALWGGTPVAIRYSVTALEPITVSGLRFAMAAIFMLFWAKWEKTPLALKPGQLRPTLILATMLFFQITLFTAGIKYANASHGTVLINTFIFWVILLEFLILRQPFPATKLLGLILASLGAALVVLRRLFGGNSAPQEEDTMLLGDGLLVLSAMILGGKILFTKIAMRRVEPTKLIFWHDVFGVVLFTAAAWCLETNDWEGISVNAVLGLMYQGFIVAGLCFAIQAHLLKRHSATQISFFSFATPIFGLVFAVLLLNEALTIWLAVSAICVAAGILLANRSS